MAYIKCSAFIIFRSSLKRRNGKASGKRKKKNGKSAENFFQNLFKPFLMTQKLESYRNLKYMRLFLTEIFFKFSEIIFLKFQSIKHQYYSKFYCKSISENRL